MDHHTLLTAVFCLVFLIAGLRRCVGGLLFCIRHVLWPEKRIRERSEEE